MHDTPTQHLKPTHWLFLGYYLFGTILLIVAFVLLALSERNTAGIIFLFGFAVIGITELIRNAETFSILEKGVVKQYKLLASSEIFVEYEKIQDISHEQSVVGLIFNYGTIKINTSGSSDLELVFPGIKHVKKIDLLIREKMTQTKEVVVVQKDSASI